MHAGQIARNGRTRTYPPTFELEFGRKIYSFPVRRVARLSGFTLAKQPALLLVAGNLRNASAILQSACASNLVVHLVALRVDVLRRCGLENRRRKEANNGHCDQKRFHELAWQVASFRYKHYAQLSGDFEDKMDVQISCWPSCPLEAKIGHDVSAFVFHHIRTFNALESGLGIFIAERRGSRVIGFGCAFVLRPAASE